MDRFTGWAALFAALVAAGVATIAGAEGGPPEGDAARRALAPPPDPHGPERFQIGPFDPGAPRTPAAERVLTTIARIDGNLRTTRYQHATVVREREGLYAWDCSGMAEWVLERAAPRARGAISRERPVARDFAAVIERAPLERPRRGWQRLAHIEEVEPGDVFAWRRPPHFGRQITGHVGFVMERARPGPWQGSYTMRIADATSLPHQDDTRHPDGEGGFGYGTLLFLTDGHGQVESYGWFGTNSLGVIVTDVVFGRVSR